MIDEFRAKLSEGAPNSSFLPDVTLFEVDSPNLVFRLEEGEQRGSQHPLCTGDKDAH
jgi:hypothetical protein